MNLTYAQIQCILEQAFRDAMQAATSMMGKPPDAMTATCLLSFLKGRIPGALIYPEHYNYTITKSHEHQTNPTGEDR